MKILFLNPAGNLGGAERVLLNVIASLRQAQPLWQLELIASSGGGLVDEAGALGLPARVIPFPRAFATLGDAGAGGPAGRHTGSWYLAGRLSAASPAVALYTRRLALAIAQSAPDVIHTNGFKMHVLGIWAARRRVPVVWHVHDFVRARPIMPRLLRAHAHRRVRVVANSKVVAADVRAALGGRVPVVTVYNAVDIERFAPAGPRLDLDRLAAMPAPGPGAVRVGLIATMARWKGHETFLRALARIAVELPVRGYVIGGPLYETAGSQYTIDELRALAAQLGLAERIGFTGFVADAAAAIRALDIVVHASTEPEPFGLVIAEAMACGKPVIAAAAGGAAEIVEDEIDALTHQPGDAADLARQIARLAADAQMRRRLGLAAAAAAARRFARARLAEELAPIYLAAARAGGMTM